MRTFTVLFVSFVIALMPISSLFAKDFAKEIHKEKSLYRNILVTESKGQRCLLFTVKREERGQSCMDLDEPQKLVFSYVRMVFGGLLLNSQPKNVLIVGLGGGSIPNTLADLFPQINIDIVEIDPAVVRVAKQYFNFTETDRIKIHVADARVYIKRAALKGKQYDVIILDAFTGEYIPEHLMTAEFLKETKALLAGGPLSDPLPGQPGILIANTFSSSRLYDHESTTYEAVFGKFLNFKMPKTGNRVIFASTEPLPSMVDMQNTADRLSAQLKKYGVNITSFPRYMSQAQDWNEHSRILTDQFNPANLLQGATY